MQIQTVLGVIPAADIGVTLMHEHVNYTPYGAEVVHYDWDQIVETSSTDLAEFNALGGRSYVDVTPIGCGRNLGVMAEISRRTGVNIVAATGFYKGVDLLSLTGSREVGRLAQIMVEELTQGVDDTGLRAGVIKLGTSKIFTEDEHLAFLAGARAHRQTGAGIVTHTESGLMAVEQARLLIDNGVDPARIVIGHMLDRPDGALYRTLVSMGVSVGIDRIGKANRPEDQCVRLLAEMVEEGFEDHFIVSHDSVLFRSGARLPRSAPGEQAPDSKSKPSPTYMQLTFLGKLRSAGISETAIEAFVTRTPARILGH